jgi:hypothetical protein
MNTKNLEVAFKTNCSNNFTKVDQYEAIPRKTSMNCNTNLFPGEFPFCGNCIHYSGPKVCPVARVSVDSTSDGTGCVMTGVYQKKSNAMDYVMRVH